VTKKRVERVQSDPDNQPESTYTPTATAKGRARQLRMIAAILWAVAIACELVAIFGLLRQSPVNVVLLVVLTVVIGCFAIGGSLLWKKANRLDPASRKDTVRFFVQNQLGAIITVIAFLPLIALILLNKDLSKEEKAIAGGVAAAVMAVAMAFGIDWDPPSTEQYDAQVQEVVELTGKNEVTWTTHGKVYHLCAEASAVNRESQDGTIFVGTVAEAIAAGKERLTKQIAQELRECGFDEPARTDEIDDAEEPDETE
jgi:hypothetical protein